MSVSRQEVIDILVHNLPRLLSEEPELRYALTGVMAETFARRDDLHSILEEIKVLREDWIRDSQAIWKEIQALREETKVLREDWIRDSQAIWKEIQVLREDWIRDSQATWKEIQALREETKALIAQHDRDIKDLKTSVNGLGARWGMMSEEAFRAGLAGILAEVGLQVERFWQMDTEGYVFGEPDQVEIDVAMHNGQTILVEIKSSVNRGDVTIFQRKVAFYEQVKQVKVTRQMIVSPHVEPGAAKRARAKGIEVYTSGYEVPL